jgi:hypothetical protein
MKKARAIKLWQLLAVTNMESAVTLERRKVIVKVIAMASWRWLRFFFVSCI